jgi:hypothetical protein
MCGLVFHPRLGDYRGRGSGVRPGPAGSSGLLERVASNYIEAKAQKLSPRSANGFLGQSHPVRGSPATLYPETLKTSGR